MLEPAVCEPYCLARSAENGTQYDPGALPHVGRPAAAVSLVVSELGQRYRHAVHRAISAPDRGVPFSVAKHFAGTDFSVIG